MNSLSKILSMKNLEEEKVLIGRPEMTLEMMMTWLKHPTNAQTSERRWAVQPVGLVKIWEIKNKTSKRY